MPDEFELLKAFVTIEARNLQRAVQGTERIKVEARSARDQLVRLNAAGNLRPPSGRFARAVDEIGDEAVESANQVRELGRAGSSLRGFGAGILGGLVGAGGALGIRAIVRSTRELVTESIKLAATFEQAQIKINAFTGDARVTERLLDSLRDFGAKTDFNFLEDLVPAAQQLLSQGLAGPDGVVDLLRQLGDVKAGAVNADLNLIIANLAQISNVGKASLQDIRQFGNQGIPIFTLLEEVTGASGDALSDLISDGAIGIDEITAAFERLTGEGGLFFGLLESSSQSTAGQLSNLRDNIDTLKTEIGIKLLPVVQDVVGELNRLSDEGFFDVIAESVSALIPLLENVGDLTTELGTSGSLARRLFVPTALFDLANPQGTLFERPGQRAREEALARRGAEVTAEREAEAARRKEEQERLAAIEKEKAERLQALEDQRKEAEKIRQALFTPEEREIQRLADAFRLAAELGDQNLLERAAARADELRERLLDEDEPRRGRRRTAGEVRAVQAGTAEFFRSLSANQVSDRVPNEIRAHKAVTQETNRLLTQLKNAQNQTNQNLNDLGQSLEEDDIRIALIGNACSIGGIIPGT